MAKWIITKIQAKDPANKETILKMHECLEKGFVLISMLVSKTKYSRFITDA